MTVTIAQLRALKPGALLTVSLKSGRAIKVKLDKYPSLTSAGKPGINRVRLEVIDIDAAAKLTDNATIFHALATRHTVQGHRVISID